jgi:hypothetical protein
MMRFGFKTRGWTAAAIVGGLLAAASGAQAANILVNPGFETGGLSPWYQSASYGGVQDWGVDSADAHSGTYSAVDIGNKELEQDFAPVAGSSITQLSFWMRHPNYSIAPMALDLFYTDSTYTENVISSTTTGWQFFDATSYVNTSKTLKGIGLWGYSSVGGASDMTRFDDVTLDVAGAAVPEPMTWSLTITGFALAGAALRRRRAVIA